MIVLYSLLDTGLMLARVYC